MKKTRVLIVEDHTFFRRGLAHWLKLQDCLICSGQAASLSEARKSIKEKQHDLILTELRFRDGEGLELIAEVIRQHPHIRIIVLSQFDEDVYAHRVLKAGARGYLMKSAATEAVRSAIETVMNGGIHLSPRMAVRLLQNMFPDIASRAPDLAKLTDRELQVFQLLGSGLSTLEIGKHLKLSPKTIETYREHLKDKLALADASALLSTAARWVESGRLEHDVVRRPFRRK